MSEEDSALLVPNQLVGNDQPIEGQSFETKAMECAVKAGAAAVKSSAHVSKKRLARRGAMSGDDPKQIVEFPKAEIVPEERARRLKIEVDRLASLPVVEWLFYVECKDVAEKHGFSRDVMKAMVEATIKANEKKAREDKAENHRSEQRVEKARDQGASGKRNAHAVSRSGPTKRLRVSKKKKIALSRRLSSCRRASAKPSSGNWPRNWTRTSSCCAMNSSY